MSCVDVKYIHSMCLGEEVPALLKSHAEEKAPITAAEGSIRGRPQSPDIPPGGTTLGLPRSLPVENWSDQKNLNELGNIQERRMGGILNQMSNGV